jgi:hypothetical protein
MTLLMYLGNDLIEAVPVSNEKLSQPGYLGSYKRQLKQKYFLLLQQSSVEPEFLVFDLNPQKECFSTASSYNTVNASQSMEAVLA